MMIKHAAEDATKRSLSVLHLKELVDDYGFSKVTTPFKLTYLEYVLQPLDSTLCDTPSRRWEVGTLFLLAFFSSDGVSWNILNKNYEKKKKNPRKLGTSELLDVLGRLEDCALIRKVLKGTDHVYSIAPGNIRESILDWIERDDSLEDSAAGLLKRYNKALSLVYKFYRSSHKHTAKAISDDSSPIHQVEQRLMPHFDCFLQFTQKHPQQQKLLLDDLAVRAVICFSKVLVDQGRHKEAMDVTEYTRKHFKLEKFGDEAQPMLFFKLGRHLINIYLTRPKDATSFHYRSRASDMIVEMQSVADRIKEQNIKWTWLPSTSLRIKLDQVKVHRQTTQFDQAHRLLSDIQDGISTITTEGGRIPGHIDNERARGYKARDLQTLVTYQNGLLHTARGISEYRTNPKAALQLWNRARELLLAAKKDAKITCPADTVWHDEIRAEIAVANTKIGKKHLIQDAIKILEAVWGRTKERYGLVQRTMDVERRLNEARLKSSKQHVKLATESSRELLDWYTMHCGQHMKDTEDCALQLARGLELMNRRDEARAVRKKYRLEKGCAEVRNTWRWKILLPLLFFLLLLIALYWKNEGL
jgi:hypothetical protein